MKPSDELYREGLATHARLVAANEKGELTPGEWRPIRLSYGLYYQLDHTSHMQRLKIPGGLLTAVQLGTLADVVDAEARGIARLTTRQDVQFHWVDLDHVIDIYEKLQGVGITTRGACSDSVRNVTACPDAGIAIDEAFDVTPYVLATTSYFTFNPLNLTLPRKFKIAISGCSKDCAQARINDIGLYAHLRGGEIGFSVFAGGGLSSQPLVAIPVREFLPAMDLLIMCEAIARVQHRYGERRNRKKARMKYLVKNLGPEKFITTVDAEFARVEAQAGGDLRAELAEAIGAYEVPPPALVPGGEIDGANGPAAHWIRTNTRRQRQDGYRMATVLVALGDLTGAELRVLADLSRRLGNGTVRLTNEQNVVIPWVPDGRLLELHGELAEHGLGNPDVLHLSDVVSCPGMDFCSLAMTRSMGAATSIGSALAGGNGEVEALGDLRVKISGCPNACGQHHVGEIGLTGVLNRDPDGVEQPHYSILVGGSVGEDDTRLARRLEGRYAEKLAPRAVLALARLFGRERRPGEGFSAFVDRTGVDRLSAEADAAVKGGDV